ncbi:TetR/AcrR family transcriptional regulator [Streptomyces sp. NBC_01218]|uniref:TetR/AcrR family transcriptional regulator n=1 Tax=unclassified Streptomyces TaxID=2593676 RepID=UPI0023B8B6ED|nr:MULTISPECIES: TetR/AcrR family transcriptional regulator [unclassified Streptomyces]WEH40297.1 TetR/AcrR family transcriptional regulator [Streptomyces sp. AM 2-1-1]WSQ51990.1 TetR/AcrR family transcriptional regulator [Streptomyces sp. NBC_01218]
MNAEVPDGPSPTAGGARPARADARRNREKLVAAARAAFAGADDTVPLETVARAAGVGIGTLYRHFPTREALVEAVFAAELDAVTAGADELLATLPPEEALRAWMDRYAGFVAAKSGLMGTLRSGWASGAIATPATRERLTAAIATLLAAGARTGSLRGDVEPDDVMSMVFGAFQAVSIGDTPERTGRVLDLVVDALRPRD